MTTNEKEEKKGGAKGFNPFVDWSFKRLFASEQNKDLLIGFLNLLLEGEEVIKDLTYTNTVSIPQNEEERGCIFDVLCTNKNGDMFMVEMQNGKLTYINNRIVYYTCRLIDKMGEKGDAWKYDLKKVYSICIMDFRYENGMDSFRQDVKLYDVQNSREFSDKIHIIMLQLPLLKWRTLGECRKSYEKLLLLLKIIKEGMRNIEELKAEVDSSPIPDEVKTLFKKLLDTTNVESLTGAEKEEYEKHLKYYRDYMSSLDCAKIEGKAEEKLSIAQSMKKDGVSADMISKYTGLSVTEVEKL